MTGVKQYYAFIIDYWKWFKEFFQKADSSDKFFNELEEGYQELYKKHGETEFTRKLVVEGVDEIYRSLRR